MTLKKSQRGFFWHKTIVADHIATTARMSHEEKGVYMDLLLLCHQQGRVPADVRRLAKMLGTKPGVLTDMLEWVRHEFDMDGDTMTHGYIEEQRAESAAKSAKRSDAGRQGNAARWGRNSNRDGSQKQPSAGRNCDLQGSQTNSNCNSPALGGVGGTDSPAAAPPAADNFWGEISPGYRAELGGADE
jgi:uncharacterized protein YdaU (DUF1376 family)